MSQCSKLHDSEKRILSEGDLGNFISWWYGPCNVELVRAGGSYNRNSMRSPTFPALPPWMLQSGCGFTPQDKSGEWSVQWRYHPLSGLPSALAARLAHASHSGNASDDAAALDSTASKPGPYKGKFSNVVPPFLWEVLKCARGARFLHYYNEREWESVYDSHYSGNRVKMTFPAPPPTFCLSGVNLEQRICRKILHRACDSVASNQRKPTCCGLHF